jgi:hypothetical protein
VTVFSNIIQQKYKMDGVKEQIKRIVLHAGISQCLRGSSSAAGMGNALEAVCPMLVACNGRQEAEISTMEMRIVTHTRVKTIKAQHAK